MTLETKVLAQTLKQITIPGGVLTELLESTSLEGLDDLDVLSNGNIVVGRGFNNGGNSSLVEVTPAGALTGNTFALGATANGDTISVQGLSNGDVFVLDRSFNRFNRVTGFPGGSAAIAQLTISGYTPTTPNGLSAVGTTVFFSDRGGAAADTIYVYDPLTNTLITSIADDVYASDAVSPNDRDGLAAYSINANQVGLLVGDFNDSGVYRIVFGTAPVSNVESWNLYSY